MVPSPGDARDRRFLGVLALALAGAALGVFVVMPCLFVFCVPTSGLGLLASLAGVVLNRAQGRAWLLSLLGVMANAAVLAILLVIANSQPLGWRHFTD